MNYDQDQISYLHSQTIPPFFAYPDEWFNFNLQKYQNLKIVKIVHASSSPLLKGTQLVHIALEKLKRDGFEFEYVELFGVSNSVVRQHLQSAHLALGPFHHYLPGFMGIEALANTCVLLTSADEHLERLPVGSNNAWIVTPADLIYENLKKVLENKKELQSQAIAGAEFAFKAYSRSSNAKLINFTITSLASS